MRARSLLYALLSVALFDVASTAHAAYSEQWMSGADIAREQSHAHKGVAAQPSAKPVVKHEIKRAPLARNDDDPIAAFAHPSKVKVR